jgi:hypothetical protein
MLFQPCWLTLYYRIRNFYFNSNYVQSLLACVVRWRHWILLMSDCHCYVSTRVTLETKRSGDAALSVHITWLTVVWFEIRTFRARKSDSNVCEFLPRIGMIFCTVLTYALLITYVSNSSTNVIPISCHSHHSSAFQLKKKFSRTEYFVAFSNVSFQSRITCQLWPSKYTSLYCGVVIALDVWSRKGRRNKHS